MLTGILLILLAILMFVVAGHMIRDDFWGFIVIATAGTAVLAMSVSVIYCSHTGNPRPVHDLTEQGNQVYNVLYQEKRGNEYFSIVEPLNSSGPIFTTSFNKLPEPQFMVLTYDGKTAILPSEEGKAKVSLSIPINQYSHLIESVPTPPAQ